MIQTIVQPDTALQLEAIVRAYAEGDAPLGELLFAQALDEELPWDEVCAAAARGISRRFGERSRV